jgi:CRP/FNR family cyclic AMP-dependent transcriptional regulator
MRFDGALQLYRDSSTANWFENDTSTKLVKRNSNAASAPLPVFYPKGAIFFLEGHPATGVFVLRTGRAKESMVSAKGRTAIIRVVGPGAILGLSAVLTDALYESTAETLESTLAVFVRKSAFFQLLKTSRQMNQMAAGQLLGTINEAHTTIRCLGVSDSVSERIARLILQWAEFPLVNQKRQPAGVRIEVPLTHEEIGQLAGTTRETTSRILGEFRRKKWIATNGSAWTVTNQDAIRHLAGVNGEESNLRSFLTEQTRQ